jgi:glycosyltransferase involved in cell wall biosynthesis
MLTVRFNALLAGQGRVQLPSSAQPDVTIILILHNQAELTLWCLASIAETLHASTVGVQTIIVDNASTDATSPLLDRIDGAEIIPSRVNLHFLRGVNAAAQLATGRHILLLNNDVQLLPGAVEAAVQARSAGGSSCPTASCRRQGRSSGTMGRAAVTGAAVIPMPPSSCSKGTSITAPPRF